MEYDLSGLPDPNVEGAGIYKRAVALLETEIAKQALSKWQAQDSFKEFEFEGLSELYSAPEETSKFRIGWEHPDDRKGLWPANGTLLIAAQAKSGKSTLALNAVHSLVTGEKFLNRICVQELGQDETMVILNNEVSASQYTYWMKKRGIPQDPRIRVANLRGKAGSVNILDAGIKALFVEKLAPLNPTILIVDPIGPIMRAMGIDENDNTTVGQLLDGFNALRTEIPSLREIMIIHHAGHEAPSGGQRAGAARGASSWNDTPDAIWNYRRDDNTKTSELKARGRDVFDNAEITINFEEETITLTSTAFSVNLTPGAGSGSSGSGKIARRRPVQGRGSGK